MVLKLLSNKIMNFENIFGELTWNYDFGKNRKNSFLLNFRHYASTKILVHHTHNPSTRAVKIQDAVNKLFVLATGKYYLILCVNKTNKKLIV